jgi:flagellar biosynthesis/type III secretory pathway protein FliH
MGRLVKRRGRVVPAAVLEARAQARELLAEARRQADALLAEAAATRAAAHESTRAALEAEFTTLLVAARADAERVRASALPAARGLAVRMAEKILGHALDLNDDVVAGIAARALEAARTRAGVVTLRIHPTDRAAVDAARPSLTQRLAAAVQLRVVDDPTVARGGCVVDTPAGRLDARLETQLAALERAAFGDGEQEARRG